MEPLDLCLGGEDGRTLFVTTNNALYRCRLDGDGK